jgi:hypothetical protein
VNAAAALLLLVPLAVQELSDMIADECTFKADGVLYTSDLKGALTGLHSTDLSKSRTPYTRQGEQVFTGS